MGMFDDLIPAGRAQKGGGMFDDLIPAKKKPGFWREVRGAQAQLYRGTGVLDEVQGGLNTLGNLVSGKSKVTDLKGAFKQGMAEQREIEDDFKARRPYASALLWDAGAAGSAFVPGTGGGSAAGSAVNASRAGNIGRGVTAASAQAAAYGAVDRGTLRERLHAATENATNPLVLATGAIAGRLAPSRGRVRRQRIGDDVRTLRQAGIEVTPGQAGGRVARSAEEAATSVPFLGDAIGAARQRQREGFNLTNARRALREIGEDLPDDIPAGHDSVRYVGDRLGQAYERVIPEGRVVADPPFASRLEDGLRELLPDMTRPSVRRLQNIIENRVINRLRDGQMDGRAFQRVQSELGTVARRFSSSPDADQQAIGRGLQVASDALTDAAQRQNPAFARTKARIDAGYAQLATIEKAAGAAGSEAGIYTPKRYMAALREGDSSVRRRRVARGEARQQDLAGAAERVMTSRTPDSGTGRRVMQGAGAQQAIRNPLGALASVGTLGTVSAAYSPRGQQLFNRILDRSIAAEDRAMALNALREEAARSPEAQRLYQMALARLPRAAGPVAATTN